MEVSGNVKINGNLCLGNDCKTSWPDITVVWNQVKCSNWFTVGAYDYYINGKIFMKDCNCLGLHTSGMVGPSYWYRIENGGYYSQNAAAVSGITSSATSCVNVCLGSALVQSYCSSW